MHRASIHIFSRLVTLIGNYDYSERSRKGTGPEKVFGFIFTEQWPRVYIFQFFRILTLSISDHNKQLSLFSAGKWAEIYK